MHTVLTVLSHALVRALPQRWVPRLLRYPDAVKFLLIATTVHITTATLFSALKWTVLTDHPVTAHILAALIATVFAYILCLAWSFSDIDRALGGRWAAAFFAIMAVSVALSSVPLWISRYQLDLREPHVQAITETASDFVASAVVGALLSTWFLWQVSQRVHSTQYVKFDDAAVTAPEGTDPPT
ncbi:UNVERIFIED_ORG: putative flippase GtrA [Rhodococcus erythropolis]